MIADRISSHLHPFSGRGYAAILRTLTAALVLHGVPVRVKGSNYANVNAN